MLVEAAGMRLNDLQRQQNVVERGAPGEQRRVLECHAADLERAADWLACDRDHTRSGEVQPGDELQQARFAAAAWSDHGDELTRTNAHGDLVERMRRTVAALISQADAIKLNKRRIGRHGDERSGCQV